MTTAAVDVLGFLPGPVSKNNAGAADLLAGELFAYAVSSGVAVVDVSLQPAACSCVLDSRTFSTLTDLGFGCSGAPHAAHMCLAWWSQECVHYCSQLVRSLHHASCVLPCMLAAIDFLAKTILYEKLDDLQGT